MARVGASLTRFWHVLGGSRLKIKYPLGKIGFFFSIFNWINVLTSTFHILFSFSSLILTIIDNLFNFFHESSFKISYSFFEPNFFRLCFFSNHNRLILFVHKAFNSFPAGLLLLNEFSSIILSWLSTFRLLIKLIILSLII